jgi:hypothetical protein
MLNVGLFAVTDISGAGKGPLGFMARGEPRYFLTVKNFHAAALAVRALMEPWVSEYTCIVLILEKKRIVPITNKPIDRQKKKAFKEALRLDQVVGVRAKEIVKNGLLEKVYEYPNLGIALEKKNAYALPSPVVITQMRMRNTSGVYEMMNVPGYKISGFEKHYVGDPLTAELIANLLYTHYDRITRAIVSPIAKISPKCLHRNALIDMQTAERLRVFVENVKFGLITAATGNVNNYVDIKEQAKVTMFVMAVQRGSVAFHIDCDPTTACYNMLSFTSIVWGPAAFWRGLSHGLPIRGLGYGMFTHSNKFKKFADMPEEMKKSWEEMIIDRIVTGIYNEGVTPDSPRAQVVKAIYSSTPPSPFTEFTVDESRQIEGLGEVCDVTLGGPRRIATEETITED